MGYLDHLLAYIAATPRRKRAREVPDYSCLVFPDTNANPALIIDIVSELDHACQAVGGNIQFRVGFTDVLLKENCNYLSFRGIEVDHPIERGIESVREWQKESEEKCRTLLDVETISTKKGADVIAPFGQLLAQAEKLVEGNLAFLVGKIPERFTGKNNYKNAKIPAARIALTDLQNSIDRHANDEIKQKAETVQATMAALGKALYATLPKTLMDYKNDRDLFQVIPHTQAEQELTDAFAKILLPQVRLRLMAYKAVHDHKIQAPEDITLTPDLRAAYAQACQYTAGYSAAEMAGIETLGITAPELQRLRKEKDQHWSYGQELLSRGFNDWQPVTVTVRPRRVAIPAEEIKDHLQTVIAGAPLRDCRFQLKKLDGSPELLSCDHKHIEGLLNGTEPVPYGQELIVFLPARTLPCLPELTQLQFASGKKGNSSGNYLKLADLDTYLEENHIANSVMSVDIVKNREFDADGKEPPPLQLPKNPLFGARLRQRLFELAKEGEKLLPEIKRSVFHLREARSMQSIIANDKQKISKPEDIGDAVITDEICYVPTRNYGEYMRYDRVVEQLQQIFYNTDATKQYMASLSVNGPYGKVKFNAGERSVYEWPVIDKQSRVRTADNFSAADAKLQLSGKKGPQYDRLAKAHETLATRDLHFFVSEDGGAKVDGKRYLQASEGHVPMLAINMKEFYLLSQVMARLLRQHQARIPSPQFRQTLDALDNGLLAYQKQARINGETPAQIDTLVAYYGAPANQQPVLLESIKREDAFLADFIMHANQSAIGHFLNTIKHSKAASVMRQ